MFSIPFRLDQAPTLQAVPNRVVQAVRGRQEALAWVVCPNPGGEEHRTQKALHRAWWHVHKQPVQIADTVTDCLVDSLKMLRNRLNVPVMLVLLPRLDDLPCVPNEGR